MAAIELLAYDLVSGFTQIGRRNDVERMSLDDCATIPTAMLAEGGFYVTNAIVLYGKSSRDNKPVEINPNNICATHRIMYHD